MARFHVVIALFVPLALATSLTAHAQSEEPAATEAPAAEAPADEPAGEEPLFAEPEPSVAAEGAPLPMSPEDVSGDWRPPVNDEAEKDWIRLNTGEWLRGNIDHVEDGTLYFDSAELDELEIDWPVISELRSSQINTYRFEGRVLVTGTAGMKDGVLRIQTADGMKEFKHGELVGYIEGDLTELNYWSGDLGFGLSALSGNTNQTDVTGNFSIRRNTPLTRTFLRYKGVYATNDGTADPNQVALGETANNHRINTGFDLYLTRRLFLNLPFVEFYNDSFQNIDVRLTPGIGVGYDVLGSPKVVWEVTGGIAYQYTKFSSVVPPASATANDAAVVVGTTFETDPLKNIEWDTIFTAQLNVTDFDKTNTHFDTTLSFDIWGPLDLDLGFVWDYIVKPSLTESVTAGQFFRPESHDIRLTVGLGLDW